MQAVIDFISGFIEIKEEEKQLMLRSLHFAAFKKNEIIHQQGQLINKMGFVMKGAVRGFYIDEDGTEHTVGFVFENNPLVAFDSFTQQTPLATTAVALEPVEVIWISHTDFFIFLDTYPRYEAALRNVLSQYMAFNNAKARLLRINSAKERYEALLATEPDIIKRVPLKYIASYLGIAIETLSRVRAGKM